MSVIDDDPGAFGIDLSVIESPTPATTRCLNPRVIEGNIALIKAQYPRTHDKPLPQLKKEIAARRKEREGFAAKIARLMVKKTQYERVNAHNESLRAIDEVCEKLFHQQDVNMALGATPRRGVIRSRDERDRDDASSVSSVSSQSSLSSHFTGVSVHEEAQPVVPVAAACSICQEDVSNGQQQHVLACCQSTFHTACIDQWVATNPTCPHCRVRVDLDALQASFARRQGLQGGSQLELFVRGVNGSTVVMCPPSNALVGDVKRMMTANGTAIPVSVQRFVFDGHELEDNRTLASYGIEDHDTLHCLLRLRGGMEASEELEVEEELEDALGSVLPSVLLDLIMEYHSDDHCHFCSEVVLEASGFEADEIQAAQSYCLNAGDEVGHFILEQFREAYRGFFNTHGDFCREYAGDLVSCEPEWVAKCIDWKYAWDYAFQYDFSEFDGHYFWGGSEVIDPKCECESCCEEFDRADCGACNGSLCEHHLCLYCDRQEDEVEA